MSRARKPNFNEQKEALLWENVAKYQGEGSPWIHNFEEACRVLCHEWERRGERHHTVTSGQLRRWFEDVQSRKKCGWNDIFVKGQSTQQSSPTENTGVYRNSRPAECQPSPSKKRKGISKPKAPDRKSNGPAHKSNSESTVASDNFFDDVDRVLPHETTLNRQFHTMLGVLLSEPKKALPEVEDLKQLCDKTIAHISSAVERLLSANVDSLDSNHPPPVFFKAVRSQGSFILLQRVFGAAVGATELGVKISQAQYESFQSPFGTEDVLRAVIGAAVHEWVFEPTFESLFPGLRELGVKAHYSRLDQWIFDEFPECYTRMIAVVNHRSVQNLNPEPQALELACTLDGAIKEFLGENRLHTPEGWIEGLGDVFEASLRLKAKVSLLPEQSGQFSWQWFPAGAEYDSVLMNPDEDQSTTMPTTVQFTLFPAMHRPDKTAPPVSRALVLKRPSEADTVTIGT